MLIAGDHGKAEILGTAVSVRPDNSLIVDIHLTTTGSAPQVLGTYEITGVDPLVSRLTPVSPTSSTTITIGRLPANKTYTYTVPAVDDHGAPAGTARGSFTSGPLPPALLANTYTLTGRTTVPLVILPNTTPNFRAWVALDLHSGGAPQIVWYYINPPGSVSGMQQVDSLGSSVREEQGNFLFARALPAEILFGEVSGK